MTAEQKDSAVARVFMCEDDRYHGGRLYEKILNLAHDMGLAGATVIRGVEGFGTSGTLHSSRDLRCSEDLPIVVSVADLRNRLEFFVERAKALLDEADAGGIITIEQAHIVFSEKRRAALASRAS